MIKNKFTKIKRALKPLVCNKKIGIERLNYGKRGWFSTTYVFEGGF